MMRHQRTVWFRALLLALSLSLAGSAKARDITQAQADSILNELRQIRQLLEQLVKANSAPGLPAPSGPVKLSNGDAFSFGQEDAPVTLVEFTDYECPFCNRFHTDTFAQLKKEYIDTGKVRFVSRDLPLQVHPHALGAAHAGRCAGEQNKFWEMRNTMIAHSTNLTQDAILKYAAEIVPDLNAFRACLAAEKYGKEIQKDIAEAATAGIDGTPGFVVGKTSRENFEGVKIMGAQPYAVFDAKIKELLLANK